MSGGAEVPRPPLRITQCLVSRLTGRVNKETTAELLDRHCEVSVRSSRLAVHILHFASGSHLEVTKAGRVIQICRTPNVGLFEVLTELLPMFAGTKTTAPLTVAYVGLEQFCGTVKMGSSFNNDQLHIRMRSQPASAQPLLRLTPKMRNFALLQITDQTFLSRKCKPKPVVLTAQIFGNGTMELAGATSLEMLMQWYAVAFGYFSPFVNEDGDVDELAETLKELDFSSGDELEDDEE